MTQKADLRFVLAIWVLPWIMMLITYLMNREYMAPLFNNNYGKIAIGCLLVWETIGCFFLERGNPPANKFARMWYATPRNIMLVIVFVFPVLMLSMLGPAIITIVGALGPLAQ